MANEDVPDGILRHGVVRRKDRSTRVAEHRVHALLQQAFPEDLTASLFHSSLTSFAHGTAAGDRLVATGPQALGPVRPRTKAFAILASHRSQRRRRHQT